MLQLERRETKMAADQNRLEQTLEGASCSFQGRSLPPGAEAEEFQAAIVARSIPEPGGRYVCWATTKTSANSFDWEVYEVVGNVYPNADGKYLEYTTLGLGSAPTRGRATGMAKRVARAMRAGSSIEVRP